MKRLLLLLALLWPSFALAQPAIVGPPNAIICSQPASLSTGVTGLTQVVSGSSGVANQRVYVCGWHITNTGSTGVFSIAAGTGTNCATATATLITSQSVTSTAPDVDHIDFATLQTSPSVSLCVNPSVNTIAGVIWYSQF